MSRNTLFTYENLEEFNKLYDELETQGKNLYPFVFQDTKDLIENETDITIDITYLVTYLQANEQDCIPAYNNLKSLDDDNKIIIRKDLSKLALTYFKFIFNREEPLFPPSEEVVDEIQHIKSKRNTIYTYNNSSELDQITSYTEEKEISFLNFSNANGKFSEDIKRIDRQNQGSLIDITSMIRAAVSNNSHIFYFAEQFIDSLSNTEFIVQKDYANDILSNLGFNFHKQAPITMLYDDINFKKNEQDDEFKESKVAKVTDLSKKKLEEFNHAISTNLIGHSLFKEKVIKTIRNFIIQNKIKQRKVLSMFLLGQSGLGKTEVARIINNALNPSGSLVKINFGNYSSQDALNSLIGSPAGYIGCENGELGMKIKKSKAGVIVFDEFEKATLPIYNFFLELLEEGSFTDLMAREYDLDGYILIFTSNISSENEFYKQIPPELQSRLDLVCEFKPLNSMEKREYVEFQFNRCIEEFSDEGSKHEISPLMKEEIINISYEKIDNLRDIKRIVQQKVVDLLCIDEFN